MCIQWHCSPHSHSLNFATWGSYGPHLFLILGEKSKWEANQLNYHQINVYWSRAQDTGAVKRAVKFLLSSSPLQCICTAFHVTAHKCGFNGGEIEAVCAGIEQGTRNCQSHPSLLSQLILPLSLFSLLSAKLKNHKEICINPETKWLQQYLKNALNK